MTLDHKVVSKSDFVCKAQVVGFAQEWVRRLLHLCSAENFCADENSAQKSVVSLRIWESAEGGSVSRAARRLGLKRQTLSNMLRDRHSKLFEKRTPPEKRLKSIIKKPE